MHGFLEAKKSQACAQLGQGSERIVIHKFMIGKMFGGLRCKKRI